MRKSRRIILDTNIWISYIIGRKLDELALLLLDNKWEVYSCKELELELVEVLNREKFQRLIHLDPSQYINFLQKLTIPITIKRLFNDCPDKKDNYLFDLALQSKSHYLVTGDKLLLELQVNDLNIISLKQFKEKNTHHFK